jgi:hypothetical protein
MHHAHHYIASLFLSAAIAAPGAIMAIPVPQQVGVQVRVYDKGHKDYHNWDDNENRAWGQYLTENHRSSHEFAKANKQGAVTILEVAPFPSRSALTEPSHPARKAKAVRTHVPSVAVTDGSAGVRHCLAQSRGLAIAQTAPLTSVP